LKGEKNPKGGRRQTEGCRVCIRLKNILFYVEDNYYEVDYMREIVVVMVAGATCAIQFAEHCYPLSLPSLFSPICRRRLDP
jgi:hypothetical protein